MDNLRKELDSVEARIEAGDIFDAVNYIAKITNECRLTVTDLVWNEEITPLICSHTVFDLLQQDPYTSRAYEKPRGYAGDAVMLDYIYLGRPPAKTSSVGIQIFNCTTVSPGALAVKWRTEHLARELDASASRKPSQARSLSMACGHLREAMFCSSLRNGEITLHALDQDPESLTQIQLDYGHLPSVHAQIATVKDLIKGSVRLSNLDLAYAAGLYDYLPEATAQALTATLFSMLAPGGKVIVPNFLTTNPVRGYMEAFMDWRLILRTPAEIQSLGSLLPAAEIASQRYYEDPYGVVGYLEVVKTG